jgi:hypothetical protein
MPTTSSNSFDDENDADHSDDPRRKTAMQLVRRRTGRQADGDIIEVANEIDDRFENSAYTKLYKQIEVRVFYDRNDVQMAVAALIFANFVFNAIYAQGAFGETVFNRFEVGFIVLFAMDLSWNLYGNFWWPFWHDAWNWFDFIVVVSPGV